MIGAERIVSYLPGAKSRVPHRINPLRLDGSMWAITTFYNPCNYSNKLENFRAFARHLRGHGIELLVLEAAPESSRFAIKEDECDILERVTIGCDLWWKEALINRALAILPSNCDKIVWLDCDVIFENQSWIQQVRVLLDSYAIVQPFSHAIWLNHSDTIALIAGSANCAAYSGLRHRPSSAYQAAQGNRAPHLHGHPGFAWAARRALISEALLYERLIVGGGDFITCAAMYGLSVEHFRRTMCSKALDEDIEKWMRRFHAAVQGSVSYAPGNLYHLWHGSWENRKYLLRHRLLADADYDPNLDLQIGKDGLLEWTSRGARLKDLVSAYFAGRREETL